MKLKTRILLIVLPISILSIVALETISFHFIRNEIEKKLEYDIGNVANTLQNEVEFLIQSTASTLEQYGDFPIFEQYYKCRNYGLVEESEIAKSEIQATFQKLLQRSPFYWAIGYYDLNGGQIVTVRKNQFMEDKTDSNQFIPLSAKQGVFIRDVYYDSKTDQQIGQMKYYLGNEKNGYGYLTLSVSLKNMYQGITKATAMPDSVIYILNRNGDTIYASSSLSVQTNGFIAKYSPKEILPTGWRVGILVDKNELFSVIRRLKYVALAIIALAVLGKIVFLTAMSQWISRPVNNLLKLIGRLSKGELDANESNGKFSITEFRLIRTSLIEMAQKLKQLRDIVVSEAVYVSIGKISSQLAHDMRSPLSVLKTYIEKEGDRDEIKDAASRSLAKLNNMAEDLLDYSKAQRIVRNKTSVDALIDGVVNEIRPEKSAKDVAVLYNDKLNAYANIDRIKINRVLTNIVVNAIQAHDVAGKVIIQTESVGRDLKISVNDSGKGIPIDKIGMIFDHAYTFGKPSGTGLGLAYCKQVVEAHDGTIEVQSEVEKGTTFTITLPNCVVDADTAEKAPQSTVCKPHLITKPVVSGKKGPSIGNVLIADEDLGARLQWIDIVKKLGGVVICAIESPGELTNTNGFDYSQVDTAIVDYRHDKHTLTDFDFISHLKKNGVKKVHLCTEHYNDEATCKRAMDVGADKIISKPINETQVLSLLH